jgi:hypothetical protein
MPVPLMGFDLLNVIYWLPKLFSSKYLSPVGTGIFHGSSWVSIKVMSWSMNWPHNQKILEHFFLFFIGVYCALIQLLTYLADGLVDPEGVE